MSPTDAPVAAPVAAPVPVRAAVRAAVCGVDELLPLLAALLAELVATVPAAEAASLVTVGARGPRLRPWATSAPAGDDLDAVQAAAGDGPAFLAAATDVVVVSDDLAADPRWTLPGGSLQPGRAAVAVALPGPAQARAQVVLVVHGIDPGLTGPAEVDRVVAALPDLAAAVAVVGSRVEAANLQVALTSNRTIGAAVGITMATRKLPYEDAAALLRTCSNRTNVRLVDLAEQVLLTGEAPVDLPVPRAPRPGGR